MDVHIHEAGLDRLDEAAAILGQVLVTHEAAVLPVEGVDLACNVALVKRVVNRLQSRHTPLLGSLALLVGEKLDGRRELVLNEQLPHLDGPSLRHEVLSRGRPRHRLFLDELGQEGIHGEAVAGEADGRRRHFGETHGAKVLERREIGVDRRRCLRFQDTEGNFAAVVLVKVLAGSKLGPSAVSLDRDHLAAVRQIDDGGRDAGDTRQFAL